ncbi:MAG: enoyl-CoA hydratase/isomerase family protein [Bacteroidota bacterium]
MQTLKITKKENYAIVELDRGKVNAINRQMVDEIRLAFDQLRNDEQVKGVVLTGKPHFFSAGLDVIELYQYDQQQMNDFLVAFGSMHIELAKFPKPFVTAISGHSPAGGLVIAITSDYRVMAEGGKYTIGLNEVAVNIQISQNLIEAFAFWVGTGKTHQYILEGKLLNGSEALACGLVQELSPLANVVERAEAKLKHYLKADTTIFYNTKAKLRKHWWDRLEDNAAEDLKLAMTTWWRPDIRQRMKAFIEYLTKNKVAS